MTKPELVPQIKPYLTIIEARTPKQKMHTSLGHAKNALTYDKSRSGTLWEWVDGEWVLLYTVTSYVVPASSNDYWKRYKQDVPWRL